MSNPRHSCCFHLDEYYFIKLNNHDHNPTPRTAAQHFENLDASPMEDDRSGNVFKVLMLFWLSAFL